MYYDTVYIVLVLGYGSVYSPSPIWGDSALIVL
jgi:hypothetical protein